MEAKSAIPADRVYLDFEPPMEWRALEDKWDTLLYLPGFSLQQLTTFQATRVLRLGGERPIWGDRWTRFYKEFQIPENCDFNAIRVMFKNDILYVQIPKITSTPAEQQDTVNPQTQPPKPQKPANKPESQREPAKEPQKPVNESLSDKAPQPQVPINEPQSQEEREAYATLVRLFEPIHIDNQKKLKSIIYPKEDTTENSETTSPADRKNGVFNETNNAPKKTLEKWGDELGNDGKDLRGASEQQGNIGDSTEKATKLDQEAPSIACGNGKSTLENYTKVVGGLARDLRQGGKLFNSPMTVLLALLLGLYIGSMIKSSEKPKI